MLAVKSSLTRLSGAGRSTRRSLLTARSCVQVSTRREVCQYVLRHRNPRASVSAAIVSQERPLTDNDRIDEGFKSSAYLAEYVFSTGLGSSFTAYRPFQRGMQPRSHSSSTWSYLRTGDTWRVWRQPTRALVQWSLSLRSQKILIGQRCLLNPSWWTLGWKWLPLVLPGPGYPALEAGSAGPGSCYQHNCQTCNYLVFRHFSGHPSRADEQYWETAAKKGLIESGRVRPQGQS